MRRRQSSAGAKRGASLERGARRAEVGAVVVRRARIQACDDAATLGRWVDNVIGAKTATDVLS
jgi:hypothetical protein